MKSWLCAALGAIAMLASPVQAGDCKPLKIFASIDMTTSADGRRYYVPVRVGGQDRRLLLDTGGVVSTLSEEFVRSLGLDTYPANLRMYDVTGAYSDRYVKAPFKIGRLDLGSTQFMVSHGFDQSKEPDVVGILGPDFLSLFDVSIDPVSKKLDLLNPDHCADKVVYWPATVLAKVPVERALDGHLVISIELDGKPFKAIVDTGAWNSTIRIKPAHMLLGVTPGGPDAPATGELNGTKGLTTYTHVFKTLSFDGVTVTNPSLRLIPDMLDDAMSSMPTGSKIKVKDDSDKPDVLLGMNILSHLHIYIAYKDRFVYFTPITTPAPSK
ncbi:MAG: aspartyl protease family protein [Rhizomicrobium sp.]|nr:aspartyl protease family protein [Rhizomicrobium sp.]